jgi:MFS family permease
VLLSGRLADRFGRIRALLPGMLLYLTGQVLWLVVQGPSGYILVGLLQGVTFMVFPIPTTLMGDALQPRLRARGIAVYRAVADVAILIAPVASGIALQVGGFTAAMSLTVAVSSLSIAVIAFAFRRARRFSLTGRPLRADSNTPD